MILKQLNTISKNDFVISTGIFLAGLFFYASGIPAKAVGLHQSDLLITLGTQLGVLPSPGYPLLTMIIFSLTSLFKNILGVAFSSHLISAASASVTLVFIYRTCLELYDYSAIKKRFVLFSPSIERVLYGLFPVGVLAISRLFWRHSLFIEKYQLSALLVSISIFLFIRLLIQPKARFIAFVALSLTLGLGVSHQWIFLPISITIIWLLKDSLKNIAQHQLIILASVFLAASIGPYLLLFGYASNQIEYSFIFDSSLSGLRQYVLLNYIGDGAAISGNINTLLESIDLEKTLTHLWVIAKILLNSFNWLLIPIGLSIFLHQSPPKKKQIPKFLLVLFSVCLIALSIVFSWEENLSGFPEVVPQAIILHPLVALLLWYGFYELVTRLGGAIQVLSDTFKSQLASTVLVLITIVIIGYFHSPEVSLDDKIVSDAVASEILNEIEPESIISCFSFSSCYALIYQQQINDINPQTIIVPFYYLPDQLVFSHPQLQHFTYTQFPYVMYDIITWNKELMPVYSIDMFENYFELLGINYGFLNYIPLGYYSQLTDNLPDSYPDSDLSLSQKLLEKPIPAWDFALQKAQFEMAKRHMFNTSIYMKSGLRNTAVNEVNIGTTLGYGLNDQMAKQFSELRAGLESIIPSDFFQLGFEAASVDFVQEEVEKLIESGLYLKALEISRGAVTIDPSHIDARLKYAELLEINQASDTAVIEYNNVLVLDPDNQTALERLEYQTQLLP